MSDAPPGTTSSTSRATPRPRTSAPPGRPQIADLEPGDRRFDTLNRAAKVLLDPAARAAYDAEHPEVEEPDGPREARARRWSGRRAAPGDPVSRPARRSSTDGAGVPGLAARRAGVVAAGLVAATVWMWIAGEPAGDDSAARDAQVAAERAVVPVLSYDYEHLEADQKAAQALMTGSYREEYDKLFTVLEDNAPADPDQGRPRPSSPPASCGRATTGCRCWSSWTGPRPTS